MHRRHVLKLASGLGLSLLLPGLDLRAAAKRGTERKKSLITLWMAGGPSQLETWDPHPGTKIGGDTQAIPTTLNGLKIAHLFPKTAEEIHSLSVVRSLVSAEGDHERGTYFLKTGWRPDPTLKHPAMGAVLANELGDPTLEIPQHVTLGNSQWPARGGFLGAELDAFKVFDPGRNISNMKSRVATPRQQRRLDNLDVVSRAFQRGRRSQVDASGHQRTVKRALKMMTSEQLKAFEIDDETAATKTAYGDSSPAGWSNRASGRSKSRCRASTRTPTISPATRRKPRSSTLGFQH